MSAQLDYSETTRELHWIQSPRMPKCADDLSFTSRDEKGRINWWDVTPAKSDNWGVHYQHGRAMAFELLDLIHNPEREEDDNEPPRLSRRLYSLRG